MLSRRIYALRLRLDDIAIQLRLLLLAAMLIVVVLLAYLLSFAVGYSDQDPWRARISALNQEVAQAEQLIAAYESAQGNSRIAGLQQRNSDLRRRINILRSTISDINATLIAPEEMVALLKTLIEQQNELVLLDFGVLPVSQVEADNSETFYVHGLEMTLQGSYEALSEYLAAIEALGPQLFWQELFVETEQFPQLSIYLKVHTLSQQEAWLNV